MPDSRMTWSRWWSGLLFSVPNRSRLQQRQKLPSQRCFNRFCQTVRFTGKLEESFRCAAKIVNKTDQVVLDPDWNMSANPCSFVFLRGWTLMVGCLVGLQSKTEKTKQISEGTVHPVTTFWTDIQRSHLFVLLLCIMGKRDGKKKANATSDEQQHGKMHAINILTSYRETRMLKQECGKTTMKPNRWSRVWET